MHKKDDENIEKLNLFIKKEMLEFGAEFENIN